MTEGGTYNCRYSRAISWIFITFSGTRSRNWDLLFIARNNTCLLCHQNCYLQWDKFSLSQHVIILVRELLGVNCSKVMYRKLPTATTYFKITLQCCFLCCIIIAVTVRRHWHWLSSRNLDIYLLNKNKRGREKNESLRERETKVCADFLV